jgi:cytochrome d ubiquinol oxidase subunit I
MHYPWWYVPYITSPMLIAAIAVLHVLISHYAVGGGLFLALETSHAYRTKDREYLAYLRKHTKFFVLLTVVLGAVTGVGIWWTIGLASPLATETLIRTFVFGWATEYVFFVVELVSALVFLYYWGRLPARIHAAIGWIYGIAAWISLVLITGITAFMLNPGAWLQHRNFWVAFFNPQFLPQTIARTGGALLLSSLYVYLHASLTLKDQRLHEMVVRRSVRPAALGALGIVVGGAGWLAFLPESAKAVLEGAAALNVLMALIAAATVVVFLLILLGPYRNPGWMSPGFALSLTLFGVAAFSMSEFVREAVRKPYVIYNVVLANQIFPEEVGRMRAMGYLEGGAWTREYVKQKFPKLVDYANHIDEKAMLTLPEEEQLALGAVLFQYHCNDCHAADKGYSAVAPMIRGRSQAMNLATIEHLSTAHYLMPPWAGTPEEAVVLSKYLTSIAQKRPAGMLPATVENHPTKTGD